MVDDQPDFRRLISFTLQNSGLPVSVETASCGREAVEMAQDDPPDLLILDIMMPEMDGFEVCEQLRSNVRTAFVPILMLTALDDAANRARGFLAGTDDYIGKPFARAELLARVRRLLERTYGVRVPAETRGLRAEIGHSASAPTALQEGAMRIANASVADTATPPGESMDAVLDLPSVLERLDDDRDLLRELAQIFLEQAPAHLGQIQAAVRSGDAKTLRERAHALKGSAGTLAGSAVSKTAARLEQMGRDGDLNESQETCATLEADLGRLVDALQRLIAQEAN